MSSVFVYGMTWFLLSTSTKAVTTAAPPSMQDDMNSDDGVSTSLADNIPQFRVSIARGGFSHWHGIRICACLLGHFFAKFGIEIGGFHQRRRSPNYINWVYFGQIIVKSTQFDQNWVLFFQKWYTDGWEIWQKIGIQIVRFSRSGRHIPVQFWWKNPPPRKYCNS